MALGSRPPKQLGQIAEEPNGHLKATRNGQTLILHRAHTKDIAEIGTLWRCATFRHSETIPPKPTRTAAHWLLVIDHHEARIFHSEIHGAHPGRILPHDVKEHFNQVQDRRKFREARRNLTRTASSNRWPRHCRRPARSSSSAPARARATKWTSSLHG